MNLKRFEQHTVRSVFDDVDEDIYYQIYVTVIDTAKMSASIASSIKQHFPTAHDDSIKYRIGENKLGIVRSKKGTVILINRDATGTVEHDGEFAVDVYRDRYDGTWRHTFGIIPTHSMTTTVAELEQYFVAEKVLPQFMLDRFDYNARIKHNQQQLVNFYINQ